MAWTDILQGSRSGLNASLDRRQSKRMGSLGMLNDTLGQISGQRHATSEREAGQNFQTDQDIKAREFASGLAETEHGYRMKERESEIGLLTDQQLAVLEAQYGFEQEARTDSYILRLSEMDQQQLDLLERMDKELTAQKGLIDYDRAKYANGSYRTKDGAVFNWSTPEQYEAAMNEMLEHQRRITALQESDRVNGENAWDNYQQALVAADSVLWRWDNTATDPNTGEATGGYVRTDISIEDRLNLFKEEVKLFPYSEETKKNMVTAFEAWLRIAERTPPSDREDTMASHTTTVTVNGNDPAADTQFTGPPGAEELVLPARDIAPPITTEFPASGPTSVSPIEQPWLFNMGTPYKNPSYPGETPALPSGVEREEGDLYLLLDALLGSGGLDLEDAADIRGYKTELETRGASDPIRQQEIKKLLENFMSLVNTGA